LRPKEKQSESDLKKSDPKIAQKKGADLAMGIGQLTKHKATCVASQQ
jgi:hypothetical protein